MEIEKEEIKKPNEKIKNLIKYNQRKYSKEKIYTKVKINSFKKTRNITKLKYQNK